MSRRGFVSTSRRSNLSGLLANKLMHLSGRARRLSWAGTSLFAMVSNFHRAAPGR